jgi:PAS domain S-box-containing protein
VSPGTQGTAEQIIEMNSSDDSGHPHRILSGVIKKLTRISLWHFVWISVVLAEIFTAIMNVINSIILYGSISYDLMLIGVVDAFFVALIVSTIVIFLIKQMRKIEKLAEDRLRESEERYRRLIELSPVGIAVHREGRILYVNPAGAKILGAKSPEELVGKSIMDLVHPDYYEIVGERLRRMQRGEVLPPLEEKFVTLDGRVIDAEVVSAPITYESELAFLTVVQDITERKRAENETKRYLAELEHANQLRELFTDIMRHDLLNPVGVIRNAAELLLDEFPDNEEIKVIMRSSNKLINMIESAAKLSKLESIKELEKETLDLKEIIERAIADMMPLLKTAGIVVENRLEKPLYINANPIIEDVFLNLLSNAAKYTADGERVVIDAIEHDKNITVFVKDYGPGIPDDDKEEIFNRFERRDKIGVRGMGMGLTIVKRIVELHGGRVWVEDNPEGGSIFYVQLPKE